MIWRMLKDDPKFDTANYHGEAERTGDWFVPTQLKTHTARSSRASLKSAAAARPSN